MKKFYRVAILLVAMTGLAAAQTKTDAKTTNIKPIEPKPAEPKPAEPAGGMPEMKPPAEIAAMLKVAGGTWRCKGTGMEMATMQMAGMTATMKMKPALGGWWVQSTFESKTGKGSYNYEAFTTFDPASKKWKRMLADNGGSWATGESTGMKDNKVEWDSVLHTAMGEAKFRDHEDLSDPKAGVKMWGEFSMDGKNWTKVYEMTCKK